MGKPFLTLLNGVKPVDIVYLYIFVQNKTHSYASAGNVLFKSINFIVFN